MTEKDQPALETPVGFDAEVKEIEHFTTRDAAIGEMLEVHTTPEEQRKVLFKLDLIMVPLMAFCYMMQYMDKLALSPAALFVFVRTSLSLQDLHGSEYSWTSTIFYFGYLAWSWPSSYLIVRLPLGKYVSTSIFLWGGILMCHAAASNFGGIMTARFFLGVGEACIAPGFGLVIGTFYTREEQPSRQAAWFMGNCVANIVSGVVAYGIGHIHADDITTWQALFIILGAVTCVIAIGLGFLLPDSPAKAIFLNKRERAIILQRTLKNKTGVLDTGKFKWDQAFQAIKDPQMWFIVIYNFTTCLWNGGITSFGTIIIRGFGFSTLKSFLMQMPLGAAQITFLTISVAVAKWVPHSPIPMMMVNCATSMIGIILVWTLGPDNLQGRMVGITLGSVFAVNIPLQLSVISSNIAGFTKRSTVSALMFVAYCIGNIAGPQFFLASEAPNYRTGIKAGISGVVLGFASLVGLLIYYVFENHRRDRVHGLPSKLAENEELAQNLSNRTDREIPSFRYIL